MKFVVIVTLKSGCVAHMGPFDDKQEALNASRTSVSITNDERDIDSIEVKELIAPMSESEIRLKLEELLKNHDWYYHYSDDHSVWRRGVAQWDEIKTIGKYCSEFEALVEQYRPKT